MQGYELIDPIIQAWAETHRLTLFNSFAGRDARFCYWSSEQGECFQISVQPPQSGVARIDAWTVETVDDRELHRAWHAPIEGLAGALDVALAEIRGWALSQKS